MTQEFENVELEYCEDDILYYLEDEDGNEIGFALEEDGNPVEYYYEGFEASDYELSEINESSATEDSVEMVVDEDAILYYLVDEDDNEIGFVIEEDGKEVECYYEMEQEPQPQPASKTETKPQEKSYFSKVASIAGFHGNKARKKAEVEIDKVRNAAEKQVDKATVAVEKGNDAIKAKKAESDLGITREGVSQATEDLNAIAKEGAATIKELKGTYDELMDDFGFLVPGKIKRKLPR